MKNFIFLLALLSPFICYGKDLQVYSLPNTSNKVGMIVHKITQPPGCEIPMELKGINYHGALKTGEGVEFIQVSPERTNQGYEVDVLLTTHITQKSLDAPFVSAFSQSRSFKLKPNEMIIIYSYNYIYFVMPSSNVWLQSA